MLYIIATPIGNLEDITLRALRVLAEVDFVLAEDTRKTGLLLKHFQIKNKLVSFYEHNENAKIPGLIQDLKSGKNIGLASSAGTPALCDPGYKLIRECRRQNLEVTSLPGPSSIVAALALTSLVHDKFSFLGYLPKKKSECQRLLEKEKKREITLVFFESPYRIIKTLNCLKEVFENSKIAVCRELTKKFEEVFEGSPGQALEHFSKKEPKGEFTLIVSRLTAK